MSGYPYGGNPPQYPPPQNPIYPQLYNPANAPPPNQPGQPTATGYPMQNPYPFQPPGFMYPGQAPTTQPSHPASMSYPSVTPTAPLASGPGYAYPGYPTSTPHPTSPVEWIPSTLQQAHTLSDRAVVAGYEGHDGSPLWVIRARFQGDLIPGKLAIKHHAAYVAWGGNENAVQNFEVCCARPETVRWVESCEGAVPPNAIAAGNTASGEPLYVGRAKEQGSLTPGKVHASHKVMYMSFAGQEVPHRNYEVLCRV